MIDLNQEDSAVSSASISLSQNRPRSRTLNIVLWSLQIFLATVFFLAGSAKLFGQPIMVATFEKIGIGQWFRYTTGIVEVTGAALLLIPKSTVVGAVMLCVTMIGAVTAHILVIGGNPTLAAVLLVLSAFVAWRCLSLNRP